MKTLKSIGIIMSMTVVVLSCNSKHDLGNYVYLDSFNVLHTHSDCSMIDKPSPLYVFSIDDFAEYSYNESCIWTVCPKCTKDIANNELIRRIDLFKEKKEKEIEKEKNEMEMMRRIYRHQYDALCQLGEYDVGTFEEYCKYIQDEDNRKQINEELHKNGYDLDDLYSFSNGPDFWDVDVMPNEDYIKWIFLHLRAKGVNTGTYNEFKRSINNPNDFVGYYDKCERLGLVESFGGFIMLMSKSDCNHCVEDYIEEHWDDLMEEARMYIDD